MPLVTYEDAKPYAARMAAHTAERHMPPMPVDNSGDCNTYSNARWLTDEQIAVIASWAEQGAPPGDPALAPPAPQPPPGLGTPDLVLDPGVDYTPSTALDDDYRCFIIPMPVTEAAFLTAFDVEPGQPLIVHHVIVYQPRNDTGSANARARDDAEEGPGYTCFGGTGVGSDPVVIWAPGGGVVEMPSGTGIQLLPDRDLIMQVHYNTDAGALPDRTRVNLRLTTEAITPAIYQPVMTEDLELAPGMPSVEAQGTIMAGGIAVMAHGVLPHMHTLGRTMRVEALTSDGSSLCLTNVDRWDFHWQNAWWYDTPLGGNIDSVTIRCSYDTSERTETVFWGEGTQDEMCLAYFYVTAG